MSDNYGVLAHLIAQKGWPPEPAATSTLVYILARYTVASDALARLASELCPGIPDHGLEWRGQVSSNEDEGIPDAEGRDHHGTRVVLEAKFDAVLTPAQLGTAYLERLRVHAPGLLLYVAPSDRIPAIWSKLLAGPAQATGQPADPAPAARTFLRHTRDDGRVVAITTWDVVLERIERAARDSSDGDLLCDIRQLAGLVRWQTRTQWLPIAAGDLSSRIGRQVAGLRDCVIKAAEAVRDSERGVRVDGGGALTSGIGRWIDLPNGIRMWVGIWPTMWGRHDVSPIWLNLSRANNYNNNSNLLTASDVQELMAKVADRLGCRAYRTADGWAVPLLPPLGAEQPDVIESLTRDLRTAIDIVGTAR